MDECILDSNSIYKKCRNSVVEITGRLIVEREIVLEDCEISTEQKEIYQRGTGFFIREDGWIVTAAHVVINTSRLNKAFEICVMITNHNNTGETVFIKCDKFYVDAAGDIAVLHVPNTHCQPYLRFSSKSENIGDDVYVLGNPLMIFQAFAKGIVRDNHYMYTATESFSNVLNNPLDCILTDVNCDYGNSGSPILNKYGLVCGLLTFGRTENICGGPTGYFVKRIAKNMISHEEDHVHKKILGLSTKTLNSTSYLAYEKMFGVRHESISLSGLLVVNKADIPLRTGGIITNKMLEQVEVGDIITDISVEDSKWEKLGIENKSLYSYLWLYFENKPLHISLKIIKPDNPDKKIKIKDIVLNEDFTDYPDRDNVMSTEGYSFIMNVNSLSEPIVSIEHKSVYIPSSANQNLCTPKNNSPIIMYVIKEDA